MWLIWTFYAVVAVMLLSLVLLVYRWLAVGNRVLAAVVAMLMLASLVLLWPLPMHGGFMLLGETLYDEMSRAWQRRDEQRLRQRLSHRRAGRFDGALGFAIDEPLGDTLSRVLVDGGGTAWYRSDTSMLYGEWLPLAYQGDLPSLAEGRARCRRYPPAGKWDLSSEAEELLLRRGGADESAALAPAPAAWLSQLIDVAAGMNMPIYRLRGAAPNDGRSARIKKAFVVRCVARSEQAPPGGYSRDDIPLREWNQYQLSKTLN